MGGTHSDPESADSIRIPKLKNVRTTLRHEARPSSKAEKDPSLPDTTTWSGHEALEQGLENDEALEAEQAAVELARAAKSRLQSRVKAGFTTKKNGSRSVDVASSKRSAKAVAATKNNLERALAEVSHTVNDENAQAMSEEVKVASTRKRILKVVVRVAGEHMVEDDSPCDDDQDLAPRKVAKKANLKSKVEEVASSRAVSVGLQENTYVFAKCGDFPWWPAQVVAASKAGYTRKSRKTGELEYFCVFFEHPRQSAWLEIDQIKPYSEAETAKIVKNKPLLTENPNLVPGIRELQAFMEMSRNVSMTDKKSTMHRVAGSSASSGKKIKDTGTVSSRADSRTSRAATVSAGAKAVKKRKMRKFNEAPCARCLSDRCVVENTSKPLLLADRKIPVRCTLCHLEFYTYIQTEEEERNDREGLPLGWTDAYVRAIRGYGWYEDPPPNYVRLRYTPHVDPLKPAGMGFLAPGAGWEYREGGSKYGMEPNAVDSAVPAGMMGPGVQDGSVNQART
ncbi:hypothetical protein FVE85_1020 [Porphyridium purpureum]|uniref:PWWP domain-containing protein n=1 Tax=Porphyridium purpureum TaxID=35688 RepID=A0A5J4Z090_PORPP|nr:hypothetical protein FVE85_1020 [Porphyridium purpureum]|eukprot:POR1532..scf208_2